MQTEIPFGWQTVPLGSVVKRVRRTAEGVPETIAMITSTGGFVPQSDKYSRFMAGESLQNYIALRRGEFAYNKGNSKTYPQGCIYRQDEWSEAAIPSVYISFRITDARLDDDFAAQFFAAGGLNQQLKRVITSGARSNGLLNVSGEDFFACGIPLPPIAKQKKIAAILASVDEAIQATEAVIKQTRRVKEGLYERFFRDAGYPICRIKGVGDTQLGQQRHPKFATGSNVRPYLRVANVLDGTIDFGDLNEMHFPEDSLNKFELVAGDILLNEGQSVHLVGRSAIYRGEISGLCVQKTLLRYRCGPRLDPDFAQAVFQYWLWTGHFADVVAQTTSMAHLTGIRFNRMKIPVPPLTEQRSIVAKVTAMNDTLAAHRRALKAHARTKAGLLQDLLTGKVHVSA